MAIKENNLITPVGQLVIGNATPNYTICFNKDGKQIGALDFNGDALKFEGEFEESARVFFDFIAESFAGRLKQEYERGLKEAQDGLQGK